MKITWLLLLFTGLLFLGFNGVVWGQSTIYKHDFGTTTINTHPYTVAPGTFAANLSSSSWTNSNSAWTSATGSSGRAISLSNTETATITLTFNIDENYKVTINQFNFWSQRSSTGAQNWSMKINNISVGAGSVPPLPGAAIGATNVTNAVEDQTTSITVEISLSDALSSLGTFRLDDFELIGTVEANPPSLSIEQQLNVISTQILDYVDTGILSYGNGNALISKLNSALNKINDGNTNAAVNQLNAFINQVNAFINSGKLTHEQGQSLINSVNEVISELNNMNKQGIEISELPIEYRMLQNYPNPFNPSTTIKFGLPEAANVTIKIYDMLGQEVKTLADEFRNAGTYQVVWNGDNSFGQKVTSGTYIYRIVAGSNVQTMKMILMK